MPAVTLRPAPAAQASAPKVSSAAPTRRRGRKRGGAKERRLTEWQPRGMAEPRPVVPAREASPSPSRPVRGSPSREVASNRVPAVPATRPLVDEADLVFSPRSPARTIASSPSRESSPSRKSASASSRHSRSDEKGSHRVSWAVPLVDEVDAKQQGRSFNHRPPGSFFSRQKSWMKGKQGQKGQSKSHPKAPERRVNAKARASRRAG